MNRRERLMATLAGRPVDRPAPGLAAIALKNYEVMVEAAEQV